MKIPLEDPLNPYGVDPTMVVFLIREPGVRVEVFLKLFGPGLAFVLFEVIIDVGIFVDNVLKRPSECSNSFTFIPSRVGLRVKYQWIDSVRLIYDDESPVVFGGNEWNQLYEMLLMVMFLVFQTVVQGLKH